MFSQQAMVWRTEPCGQYPYSKSQNGTTRSGKKWLTDWVCLGNTAEVAIDPLHNILPVAAR
jgi:hypothetical protein